ncbi:MAG: DUF2784 domain-containing protein [Planctomycetaceae bacterium]|nr:DUF2784 domain-containing protein [Planctomycetaceae bacterium]
MSVFYRVAADFVLVAHFAYVGFVLFGQLAILLGMALKWNWTRHPKFRILHLTMIGIVVVETLVGITCPLTIWEQRLREWAGQATYSGDFIANWLHDVLFIDAPPWAFTVAYLAFGAAVLLSFIFYPPKKAHSPEPTA